MRKQMNNNKADTGISGPGEKTSLAGGYQMRFLRHHSADVIVVVVIVVGLAIVVVVSHLRYSTFKNCEFRRFKEF